ncbi:MAG: right-handed parallel beta-helix repeat-containing protein [Betaproteobacteria bacterium]|nr:right-handed parallel beta-helix repeat-containing protein [Betaproteobacteria bacterium]
MLRSLLAVFALMLSLLAASLAHAVQRTFVSTSGSDANTVSNCSATAPCRGFAAALTVADPGGEIIVLSSGGYGPVAINKSVSIIAPEGVYAGISVTSGNGITIATAGVDVVLRGLSINGIGGAYGIDMTAGTSLAVENCAISNMSTRGLSVATGAKLKVLDSVFTNNGVVGVRMQGSVKGSISGTRVFGSTNALDLSASTSEEASLLVENSAVSDAVQTGVTVIATGTGTARLTLRNTSVSRSGWEGVVGQADGGTVEIQAVHTLSFDNAFQGFYALATASGTARMDVRDSVSHSNSMGVYIQGTTGTASGSVSNSLLTENGSMGLRVYGSGGKLTASGNVIMRNGTGMSQASSGVFNSAGNNLLEGNSTPTSGTISPISMY